MKERRKKGLTVTRKRKRKKNPVGIGGRVGGRCMSPLSRNMNGESSTYLPRMLHQVHVKAVNVVADC